MTQMTGTGSLSCPSQSSWTRWLPTWRRIWGFTWNKMARLTIFHWPMIQVSSHKRISAESERHYPAIEWKQTQTMLEILLRVPQVTEDSRAEWLPTWPINWISLILKETVSFTRLMCKSERIMKESHYRLPSLVWIMRKTQGTSYTINKRTGQTLSWSSSLNSPFKSIPSLTKRRA